MRAIFIKLKSYTRILKWCFFAVFVIVAVSQSFAQKFKPDHYGYVASPGFRELIRQRNYKLVSAFDTVLIQDQYKILATVIKDDKPYHLDIDGNELPYYDVNANFLKAREQWREKPYKDAKRKYEELTARLDKTYEKNKVGNLYGLTRKSG